MNDINEGLWNCKGDCIRDLPFRKTTEEFRQLVDGQRFTCFVDHIENHLMWAHYAGGFSGVALEYHLDVTDMDLRQIDYVGVPMVSHEQMLDVLAGEIRPQDIGVLQQKDPFWDYEKEWRLYGNNGEKYINRVRPRAVILGSRSSLHHEIIAKTAALLGVRVGYLVPGAGIKLSVDYDETTS